MVPLERGTASRLQWLEDGIENAEIETGGVDNSFMQFNLGNQGEQGSSREKGRVKGGFKNAKQE